MTLYELKEVVDKLCEYAGPTAKRSEVFVAYKGKEYMITKITQFSVVSNAYIYIGKKVWDEEEFNKKYGGKP